MARISKRFTFEAAHYLPHHKGACRSLHGHSYQVVVTLSGRIRDLDGSSSEGMVLDFADLSAILKPHLDHDRGGIDHVLLNDVLPCPTAERLGAYLYGAVYTQLREAGVTVETVAVYETATSCAEVGYADWEACGFPTLATPVTA